MTDKDVLYIKEKFSLSEKFLKKYENKNPNWGPLGYITYKRTYARPIENENRTEEWWETLKRVIEGTYTIQKNHCKIQRLPWNEWKAQKSAQKMFKLMWEFKFLPPGRGLWAMGTDVLRKKGSAALQNCAFVSTKDINFDFSGPFVWLMNMSMMGVGVSFDTKGKEKIVFTEPKTVEYTFVVEDSKEGWCELVGLYLDAYVGKGKLPTKIDYSKIRPIGSPIKTFGGTAPGPEPLKKCINEIIKLLNDRIESPISSSDIVDLMNIIGKCVVSGGVRRTAELALGDYHDEEYLKLKDPENEKELKEWRWASNNSVFAYVGMKYDNLAKQAYKNGEPGFIFIDNIRAFGRLSDGRNFKDEKAEGVNPCGEMNLENYELCNLVETFPSRHETYEEYKNTLKYAYLYAKTVTLIPTHNERTNSVMLRNRRIGVSQSGIIESFSKHGRREHFRWCDNGYSYLNDLDNKYSRWLCIPESIKMTTVKPSGSVSLLPGVTPGIHYPHSEYYYRTIRILRKSPLMKAIKDAGYKYEESVYGDNCWVVYFPCKTNNFVKGKNNTTIWEQVSNSVQMQRYWSDNSISQTVTVKKEEKDQIKDVLECFEDSLKSISFLPLSEKTYEQSPYQEITKDIYEKEIKKIKKLDFSKLGIIEEDEKFGITEEDKWNTHDNEEKYCDGETCILKDKKTKN
jgi:ribonucleoside-triphosphate reductase (thioredoxin)